jgi:hypothetical protein
MSEYAPNIRGNDIVPLKFQPFSEYFSVHSLVGSKNNGRGTL